MIQKIILSVIILAIEACFLPQRLSAQLIIGALDIDYTRFKREFHYLSADYPDHVPRAVYPCFIYQEGVWREFNNDSILGKEKQAYLYLNGVRFKQLKSRYRKATDDYIMHDMLDVGLSRSEVRKTGQPDVYDRYEGITTYPPLFYSNKPVPESPFTNEKMPVNPSDSILLEQLLEQKAAELDLGPIPRYTASVIDSFKNVWRVTDSVKIIEADLNLQLYCFIDTVKFEEADDYGWHPLEKYPFEQLGMYEREPGVYRKKWKTRNCLFIIVNNKLQYINRGLRMIYTGDIDGDGNNEFVFRKLTVCPVSYILFQQNTNRVIEHTIKPCW